MIRGPGIPPGLLLHHLLTNADLAPTLADLAGLDADPTHDGRSFAELLDGQGPPAHLWRAVIPLAHWNEPSEPRDYLPDFRGLRSRQFTYVEYATGDRELYDNYADPLQLENLAGSASSAFLAQLSARTARLARCAGASCREAETRSVRGALPVLPAPSGLPLAKGAITKER